MSILHAVVLGAVQGLTEFVPVSSSGHLVLLHRVFGIDEPTLFFDVMLHGGTLLAVFVVLWRDIWAILQRPIQPLTGFLILGTIPAIIAALVFRGPIEQAFETGRFLGFSFLITSMLLCCGELLYRRGRTAGTLRRSGEMNWRTINWYAMNWQNALFIGVFQAVAILPGVSRSGATITGALSCGLNRELSARFSFLLSIPAILGALVLHLNEMAAKGMTEEAVNSSIPLAAMIAGTVTAAIVGFFAVKFMLKIIREKSLFGFAIYTAALGTLVLIDQFGTRFVF